MTSATWNSADKSARITLSGGNLVATADNSGNIQAVRANSSVSSGKKYYELTVTDNSSGNNNRIGLANSTYNVSGASALGSDANSWSYAKSGFAVIAGSGNPYGAAWTTGDVISVLWNADTGDLIFWKNGVSQGTATTGLAGTLFPAISFAGGAEAFTANFGASAFAYTPPAGYTGWTDPSGQGAVTIAQLTAFGWEPGGSPSMALATASGTGPPYGDMTMELPTVAAQGYAATTGSCTMELATATGTGTAGSNGQASVVMEEPTADGVLDYNNVATAALTAEKPTAFAYTPPAAALVMELPTMAARSDGGQDATAALVLLPVAVAAVGIAQGAAAGAVVFQSLTALGTAKNSGASTAALTMRAPQVAATGIGGQAGAGAAVAKQPTAVAVGYQVSVATGTVTMPRSMAYGAGDVELTSELDSWTMNMRTNAVTKFPSYPVNSVARYNGTYLGAGPDGLLALEGDGNVDFDGSGIPWVVRTGATDDKKSALKRITEVLMGVKYDGPVRLRIWKDDSTYYDYSLPNLRPSVLQQVRAKPGKGLRSRYYKVELSGVGTSLEMDSLQATMPETTRRIG